MSFMMKYLLNLRRFVDRGHRRNGVLFIDVFIVESRDSSLFFLLLLRLFLARCCGRRQRHWAGGAVGNKIRVRLFCWRLFFLFFSFLVRVAWFVFVFVCFFFALEPGRNERESAREVRSSSSVWIWCISPEKKKFFLVWKSILWRFFFKWMNEWQRTMSNLFLSIRSHQSIHFNYFFNVSLPIWIH